MTRARIAALVLAAGAATRFGSPKQLQRLSGRPLLERTLDFARYSTLDPKYVVIGAAAEQVRREVNLSGFVVIENPRFSEGQATSLAAGLRALPEDLAGVVVMLGDQPLVRPWQLDRLAEAFQPGEHVAVRPVYGDGPGNPVLLGRELFPELLALSGDVGARDVLRRHQARVADVPFPHQPTPRDVDTPADFAALQLDWASTGAPEIPHYCQRCGAEIGLVVRHDRLRPVCPACNFTYFHDPKIAVVVVVDIGGRIVLQRRAIDPGIGRWTFPGGFADRGEVLTDAAIREVHEEVGLRITDPRLLGIYSEPGETVVLVAYSASVSGQTPTIGDESSDVRLFDPDDVPDFAFPRDSRVLAEWRQTGR
jgi:CTP:molybdopterin cytidylyltransferase MocA/ADP-ribose pyrophosphatase YjhB (NUDIX family)